MQPHGNDSRIDPSTSSEKLGRFFEWPQYCTDQFIWVLEGGQEAAGRGTEGSTGGVAPPPSEIDPAALYIDVLTDVPAVGRSTIDLTTQMPHFPKIAKTYSNSPYPFLKVWQVFPSAVSSRAHSEDDLLPSSGSSHEKAHRDHPQQHVDSSPGKFEPSWTPDDGLRADLHAFASDPQNLGKDLPMALGGLPVAVAKQVEFAEDGLVSSTRSGSSSSIMPPQPWFYYIKVFDVETVAQIATGEVEAPSGGRAGADVVRKLVFGTTASETKIGEKNWWGHRRRGWWDVHDECAAILEVELHRLFPRVSARRGGVGGIDAGGIFQSQRRRRAEYERLLGDSGGGSIGSVDDSDRPETCVGWSRCRGCVRSGSGAGGCTVQ